MLPAGTRCPASAAASSNCRSARSKPCMTDIVPGNRTLSRQNTPDPLTLFQQAPRSLAAELEQGLALLPLGSLLGQRYERVRRRDAVPVPVPGDADDAGADLG